MKPSISCWCGNSAVEPFTEEYWRCPACESLVWKGASQLSPESIGDSDYYSQRYWFEHQVEELGLPDIRSRSRTDIIERCLYWLRAVLAYRLPPAKVLELGSSHGAFVALLNLAGYAASGLEISPAIAEFSRRTFGVTTLSGPVEEQQIFPKSLDMIILMDVLEHLPDPEKTMRVCSNLLKDDGLFVIQTPCYPAGKTFNELTASNHLFTRMLVPQEHIYLFSLQSARLLFQRLGIQNIEFLPAIFKQHDLFLIASREPLAVRPAEEVSEYLLGSPNGRIVLALLDLYSQTESLKEMIEMIEADRAARLEVILRKDEAMKQEQALIVQQQASIAQLEIALENQKKVLGIFPYQPIRKFVRRLTGK